MSNINTDFSRLLGIRTPIVSGPMAGASGGALAAQVSLGGGLGFIAAGYDSPEKFSHELALARAAFQIPAANRMPLGVGFLCWQLEKPDSPAPELLSIALENGVQAVWFSFGTQIGRWVQSVRDHDRKVGSHQKTVVFVQVSSEDDILAAVNEWNVDVLVVQGFLFHLLCVSRFRLNACAIRHLGIESGGHGLSTAPLLSALIPSALPVTRAAGIPLLAAGGLATGAHVASVLALGASGAVLGTRFLLTPESLYTDKQRQALLDAKSSSTVRTMAFDNMRGTLGWPKGVDGRGLRNLTVDDFEKGRNVSELKELFQKGQQDGDRERMLVWAGTGVGSMNSIKPAKVRNPRLNPSHTAGSSATKDVVEELHRECVEHLELAASYIVHMK